MTDDRWIPLGIESLGGSGEYEGHRVSFFPTRWGGVTANLWGDDMNIVDQITGHSFMEVYETVAREWPGAVWNNKEE